MLKKHLSFVLVAALLHAGSAVPSLAKSKVEAEAQYATKVKDGIAKLGLGKQAHVSLKLRDKTKLSGYLAEVRDDGLVVADLNTGATTTVYYPDVTQVNGNNLSTGAKVAITAGVIAAVIIVLYITKGAFCDGC